MYTNQFSSLNPFGSKLNVGDLQKCILKCEHLDAKLQHNMKLYGPQPNGSAGTSGPMEDEHQKIVVLILCINPYVVFIKPQQTYTMLPI